MSTYALVIDCNAEDLDFSFEVLSPLDQVQIRYKDPIRQIKVYDGSASLYHATSTTSETRRSVDLTVSGAVGRQVVVAQDEMGRELKRIPFDVSCETHIEDDSGTYRRMLHLFKANSLYGSTNQKSVVVTDEDVYALKSGTSRASVLSIRGARYFTHHLKDTIDLFAKYQREDGMIWDFASYLGKDEMKHFEWRWPPEFKRRVANGRVLFARQPVMNDLDYPFILGVYLVWQATGDNVWMKSRLDNALAAMRFSKTNPYFWSEKFRLLRRPYTIDTWDFTSDYDAAITGGDFMDADLEKTTFGVMHGDSTGMADACRYLAQMLSLVGRHEDAAEARDFADHLQRRVDEVAWNGEFYTHHVSEDPSFKRDFGVDESKQVSLSNACALNRGIDHEKAVAILRTYQKIREEMPETAGGEFYMIYPPYEKGFHLPKWEYANGGVLPLIAGELASGAFEHGFESYAVDILDRVVRQTDEAGLDRIPWGFRGKLPDEPERTFESVDLRATANADLVCDDGRPGFFGEPGLDIRELPSGEHVLDKVPFHILDPAENDGKACVRIAFNTPGFYDSVRIDVKRKLGSLYFLHAIYGAKGTVGEVDFHYTDGTVSRCSVERDVNVSNFWAPVMPDRQDRKQAWDTVISWRGTCPRFWNVGLTAHGMNNPRPEKEVEYVELSASGEGKKWIVVALTASDAGAFYMPDIVGHGVNITRSAGSLVRALVEGLAGVHDVDHNMRRVRLTPRWSAAGTNNSEVCITYPEGKGYVFYRYRADDRTVRLSIAGNGAERSVEVLLPPGKQPSAVRRDGSPVDFELTEVEDSKYVCFQIDTAAAFTVEIELS